MVKTIEEIIDIQNKKLNYQKISYNKIYNRVISRVTHMAQYGKTKCEYTIPPILYGLPKIDTKYACDFIIEKLSSEGYLIERVDDVTISINWDAKLVQAKKKKEKEDISKDRLTEEMFDSLAKYN